MDRRLTPYSGRVALGSLRGRIAAEEFSDGADASVAWPLADLLDRPKGSRDRQLLLGDALTVIDRQDEHVFVRSEKDGYCGWLHERAIAPPVAPTHWVAAPASHLYSAPKVQAPERSPLYLGARLRVTGTTGNFAETDLGFVPLAHLRDMHDRPEDPVAVAESLLGAPYLWGGNSHAGIDCSGLVQVAMLACGRPCPGDSDLQQALGSALPEGARLRRGDLLFWRGHVALVVDPSRLIHANGHSMSVACEEIAPAIARIIGQGGGPITSMRRL